MNTLSEFHFLRPSALLLLLVLPLFWVAWRRVRAGAGAWRAAVDPHLLPYLLERGDDRTGRTGLVLATTVWTLACIALAGPAWEREPMPLYHNQAARVLALELAPTMYAQDERPNRLARARFKIDDILGRSRDYQTALIGYAGDAFVAAPLTDDVGTVHNLVDALDPGTMPAAGNDTARAIEVGAGLIEQAGLHRGEILLLADAVGADAVGAARRARAKGYTVSVLGIGSAAGAPVPLPQGDFLKDDGGNLVLARRDEAALRAVAEAGGGRYVPLAADGSDLDALLQDNADADARSANSNSQAESARWRDRGPWLLLGLLPLALLGFRRGWLMAFAAVVAWPAHDAGAASFVDLWKRADQQAAGALEGGDTKRALDVAPTPDWRAAAAYRDGDYEAALQDYERTKGADGAYNKANALAKLGRYEEAIAAYDEALKLAPDMEDAKANRQAVQAFMEQQQPQDSRKNGKDGKDQQDSRDGQQTPQQGQKGDDDPQGGQGDPSQQNPQQQQGGQDSSEDGKDGTKKDAGDDAQKKPSPGEGEERKEGAQQEGSQQPDDTQQKALSKEIDQALANESKQGDESATAPSGTAEEDDASREKKQALEHWLQRVPDDPGGLLRRKFQLEYQRRQQRGGEGQ